MKYRVFGRELPLVCGALGMAVFPSCTQDSGVKVYNTAPAISITAPPDGTEVDEGQVVTFEAFAQDDTTFSEALIVDWSSDLDGLISDSMNPDGGGAVVFHTGVLAPGNHVITVNVLDGAAASGSDYISMVVFDVPDAPEISVVHPVQGEYGVEGEAYVFVSMVSDEQDAADTLSVAVESDVEGPVCQSMADATGVATCEGQLTTGDHFVTFTVEDTDGYTAAETVAFEVRDGFSIDHDGDGQSENEGDCDDTDPSVYDGAEEFQNGIDDDCDGEIDEGTFSYDDDGDCHCEGLPCLGSVASGCGQLSGGDCDDTDATVSPTSPELCDFVDNDCDGEVDEDDAADAATWHVDLDSDGFGDPSFSHNACGAPFGYVADNTDCDDSRASVNPNGTEVCNSLDDDCNGTVDDGVQTTFWRDQDGDGHGDALRPQLACSVLSGFSAVDDDCDDTDATISPSATEYCNSIDDNCDGTVDEATAADASTWYGDVDGDGYGNPLNLQVSCTAPSGFGADNSDCNDANAAIYPGALEYCDGVDNNCDGTVDEASAVDASTWYTDQDSDGFGDPNNVQIACWQSPGLLLNAADCDDSNSAIYPGATETCNGVDDDCDGQVDDGIGVTWYMDADGDGQGNAAIQTVQCSQPFAYVANALDCNDFSAAAYQGAAEVCGDAIDNDCDGATDEGCTTYVNVSTSPNAPIYDYNTTVSTLSVSGCNTIVSLSMPLTLYHTYQGDLIIDLRSPSGSSVNLWNGSGGSTNNIITTFSPTNFNGQTGNGTWTLTVYDRYYIDSGTLASWGLNLTCN